MNALVDTLFAREVIGLDLEGDGNAPAEPVEVAIVPASAQGWAPGSTWLINPGRPMNRYAMAIHGLTDEDLKDCPPFEEFGQEILQAINGKVVIGHGVRGDLKILNRKLPGLEPLAVIDTFKLARAVHPGLASYRLHALAEQLGVPCPAVTGKRGEHSAAYDAALSINLFLALATTPSPAAREYFRQSGLISRSREQAVVRDRTPGYGE